MSDITMCKGGDCPLKEKCHRYTATPGDYQSYFVDPPFEDAKCDLFWGEAQESILEQLIQIVGGTNNLSNLN